MKKVLVISSTLRKNGNSAALANEFAKGAAENGNKVELVTLADKKLGFCMGCLACQKLGKCVINDDANEIMLKMCEAEVIAFATPIYYYEMSGQLKTMLDRANALYKLDYKYRDIYVLSTAADDDEHAPDRAVSGIEGWIDCFKNVRLAGTVFAGGVDGIGAIEGHKALTEAYNMGKSIE